VGQLTRLLSEPRTVTSVQYALVLRRSGHEMSKTQGVGSGLNLEQKCQPARVLGDSLGPQVGLCRRPEQAGAILERVAKEPRISLKCFCEALNGHVILKSCVAP
jgi:hypothetical protein